MKRLTMIVAAVAATCMLAGQGLARSPARPKPESLQGVKKGDTITVSLALQDNGPTAGKEKK